MGWEKNKKYKIMGVEDLGKELHPFFNTSMGKVVGHGLLKLLCVSDLNKIHADYLHLKGDEAVSAILRDPRVDVRYTIHNEERLQVMREMKAFFTISNHPFGGLDGLILIDIMSHVREDFMVLVNGILNKVTVLREFWIPVHPEVKDRQHSPDRNVYGIRMVAQRLIDGHPVGMFPAGGLPHFDHRYQQPMEIPWKLNNIRIMKKARVPIIPIMFEGNNSEKYFRFGEKWGYNIASILIPKEILNKPGENIDVYIGEPILPEQFDDKESLEETRIYLMKETLGILPSYRGKLDYLRPTIK